MVRNDSDLFDLLHRLFGIGEWDEDGPVPWWKFRQGEAAKIKRSRTARGVALEDLATAAYFCKAHNLDVRAVTWLYRHIMPALRWQALRDAREANRYLDEEMARALQWEYEHMEDGWYDRLSRAQDRALVLSQWKGAGRG